MKGEFKVQKIVTFLWFNGEAEEAASFYTSLFKDSSILSINPGPDGKPLLVSFQLAGQRFMALNGGPQYTFSPAVSLYVNCESQEEIDDLWAKLTDGGEEQPCGWLKDRFGVSWQIIPAALGDLLQKDRSGNVVNALLKMKKIDIATLQQASKG